MIALGALVGVVAVLVWLWRGARDPLIQLVPFALAFPPLTAYGARALDWPGGWLSTRVALFVCTVLFLLFRLVRRDFSYHQIPGVWFIAPYVLLVIGSVLWGVLGVHNDEAGTIGNEFLSWVLPVVIFFLIAGSSHGESDFSRASRVLVGVALCVAIYSGFQALVLAGGSGSCPAPSPTSRGTAATTSGSGRSGFTVHSPT